MEDMFFHYRTKLSDVLEFERKAANQIRIALEIGQQSWEGLSGKAFRIRLEDTLMQMEKAEAVLENVLTQLAEMENASGGVIL